MLSTYIVEETASGFNLIDQHALHERLLYDDLCARAREATVSRQRLLVPEVVELKPADAMMVMELKDSLARVGLEVEDFGGGSVAVQAVPHMMRHANPAALLKEIVEDLRAAAEDSSSVPREERLLRSLACRGAVKAGKPLRPGDIEALLDQRDRLCPAPTCPHGRPHTLVFSAADLERQFRRRV